MQISNYIQAQNSEHGAAGQGAEISVETAGESAANVSVWKSKNNGKAKAGLFAKLLDGLTGKLQNKKATNNISMNGQTEISLYYEGQKPGSGLTVNAKKPGNTVFSLLAGKNNAEAAGNSSENGSGIKARSKTVGKQPETGFIQGGNPAENQRESRFSNQINMINSRMDESNNRALDSGVRSVSARQRLSAEGASGKTGFSDVHETMAEGLNKEVPDQNLLNDPGAKTGVDPEAAAQSRSRSAKAAVDVFPPRNPENRFYQFTGEPRPAVVDAIVRPDDRQTEVRGAETRGRRGRSVVEVRDMRTIEHRQNNTAGTVNSPDSSIFGTEKADVDIPVELRGQAMETSGKSAGAPNAGGFEDALAQKLNDGLNSDIVRQASIVLRNGGEGVIRLSLKPETLGNVKIRLEMTENKITGLIIVESSEALRAFERELPVLEKAFRDSGFSETNLDMFFAQDGNYSQDWQRNGDFENRTLPAVTPEKAASSYESETDRVILGENAAPELTQATINMLI